MKNYEARSLREQKKNGTDSNITTDYRRHGTKKSTQRIENI
jgi:hypothetical protein